MTSVRGRGRGLGGGRGGGPAGQDGGNRRGSWRNGPPGSNGTFSTPRGGSPALGNASPAPRQSINDHMNVISKVSDDKPRSASAKAFATDTDISGGTPSGAQRELQPWSPDGPEASAANGGRTNGTPGGGGGNRDAETFGFGGPPSTTPWDQFETNARLFGTTTNYQEELYTTKLNKQTADFKQREKEATRLANEIMGQTASNPHIAEERNQAVLDGSKNEEEKYSGVQRNPNAYVPPAARRATGQGNAPPSRPSPPASNPAVVPTGPKANGSSPLPAKPAASAAAAQTPAPATSEVLATPAPVRRTSDIVPTAAEKTSDELKNTAGTSPPKPTTDPAAPAPALAPVGEQDGKQAPTVVEQFRDYIGLEREKVEAKKQSLQRQDRERTLADFKKFQTSFKVPLPMPKDILPLLAKDEEKQKAIEAKAATALESAKRKPEAAAKAAPAPVPPKKITMKIPEIPPFKPRQPSISSASPAPPTIAVPESATRDIPLATSPTPSTGSQTSQALAAKLNPKANSFVFKPNPSAAAFKPGQASTTSPAPKSSQPSPAAGPSVPKQVFFREPPQQPKVNALHDFNPWKHNDSLPAASSIHPQWPYTGRKYNASFMGPPMHPMPSAAFDEEPPFAHAGPPHLMQGVPGNFPPYGYRYQPGVPPQGIPPQMGSPMFSPGPGYAQIQGGGPIHSPGHIPGGPPQQPNGMPLHFYQNGMPQNPQFIPPQHLQFNPNSPQRQGPGGPGPGPGGPMFYQHQIPTPQQTPQMHHNALQPPPQQPYQSSPLQQPQSQIPTPGSFDGGGH